MAAASWRPSSSTEVGNRAQPIGGLAGASSDGRYVIFRGVTTGTWTLRWR